MIIHHCICVTTGAVDIDSEKSACQMHSLAGFVFCYYKLNLTVFSDTHISYAILKQKKDFDFEKISISRKIVALAG